jgi:hypothetical protein
LDPLLPKQMRYQAALHSDAIKIGHWWAYTKAPVIVEQYSASPLRVTKLHGSGGWDRTNDRRINSPLLYQLSYTGIGSRGKD